ncbi:MAG: YceI family protein, partial [Desulforhopalus sp.]
MNKKIFVYFVVFFLLGIIGCPLYGAIRPWEIDKEHTNFYFSVDHIYAKVHGRFTDFEGTILFDPEKLDESRISFEISVKSLDTGISKRDRHVLSEDFLDASRYPLITFTSNGISKSGENTYNVNGVLTIKGVSSELILPLTYEGMKDHPLVKG